ncbi:glucokinase [Roseospirillum parvum]|uniref:Glucokinase n=1 Tax=Roseospirillum parvum TaxID=83401 RepID=A0A1G7WGZ8_9PROT|nr:glucokinase [Roseospirillum parvum]SDG71019.1 glucokinase [Roseospirillum parvum]
MPPDRAAPRLLADIGGTNVRFALAPSDGPGEGPAFAHLRALKVADFPDLAGAARAYLDAVRPPTPPASGCIAVAGPVGGNLLTLTNHAGWRIDLQATAAALGLTRLTAVNDFVANAHAVAGLGGDDLLTLRRGAPDGAAPRLVMGPGTGLGVALLVPCPEAPGGWHAVATEGGHASIAAQDDAEWALLADLRRRFGHVSAERVASGPGLVNLYGACCRRAGRAPAEEMHAAAISAAAVDGSDPQARAALDAFFAFLGNAAGSLALATGARGGVWLMGGILPRLAEALTASAFFERFTAKGRFADWLGQVPVHLVTHPAPALVGLAGAEDDGAADD